MRAAFIALSDIGARNYATLGEAEGLSCQRHTSRTPPSEAEARNDLVVNATHMDADAVTNVVCESGGRSFRHGCVATIMYKGTAIQWLQA